MARSNRIYSGPTDVRNRRTTVYRSPRMTVEFELNRQGIARVAMSDPVHDACRSVAINEAVPFAIQNSPHDTGDYISSFHVRRGEAVIAGMRRAVANVWNLSDHASRVEYAPTRRYPAGRRVLGRTLEHLNAANTAD